jgi:hypothetical protein
MQQKPHKRTKGLGERPALFGEQLTADHIVAQSLEDQSMDGDRDAVVITDRATGFLDCYPVRSKSAEDAYKAFQEFLGPRVFPLLVYTDNSQELIRALTDLGVVHEKALPYRPQSNGVAERAVRRVLEGSRSVLLQSGLPPPFWSYACRHFCFAHNISMSDGDSPWNRRFAKGHWKGPKIPFGCLVDFLPISPLRSEKPKFGPNAVPGIFLGYVLSPGARWKGQFVVAALQEFHEVDFSVDDWSRNVRTQVVMEVVLPFTEENVPEFRFPLRTRYEQARRTLSPTHRDELASQQGADAPFGVLLQDKEDSDTGGEHATGTLQQRASNGKIAEALQAGGPDSALQQRAVMKPDVPAVGSDARGEKSEPDPRGAGSASRLQRCGGYQRCHSAFPGHLVW